MRNDKTKWIFDDAEDSASTDVPSDPGKTVTGTAGNEATVHIPTAEPEAVPDDRTVIYSKGRAEKLASDQEPSAAEDPVTGWLVVVRGPGLGSSVALGSGMNTVGRASSARVPLPFGDKLISSEDHLRIIYDDADRKFHIAHGSGKNISRVNGRLLANTMELEPDSVIELSKATRVVFKAFCNENFDWSDLESETGGA